MRKFFVGGLVLIAIGCSSTGNADSVATAASQSLSLGAYDASAAVTYADAHWADGVGLCAEFTSRSLRAGQLDIDVITYVPTLVAALAGVPYEEHAQGDAVNAKAGDVVVYSDDSGAAFCSTTSSDEHNCGHVCIVTVGGASESQILADCHNNAHEHIAIGNILGGSYTTYRIYHVAGKATPPGTTACATDRDCNHGASGSGVVCAASEGYCIKGCHSDDDCASGTSCVSTQPHSSCE